MSFFRPYEFWILDRHGREVLKRIRTDKKSVKYANALYTIDHYEDKYVFKIGKLIRRKVYIFIEGNPTPITLGELQTRIDAYKLSTIIETLAVNLARTTLEQYIKIAVALSFISLIICGALAYYLYVQFPSDLQRIVIQAIASTHAKPI